MHKRKLWFRFIKAVQRKFVKKPEMIYFGEGIPDGSLILCNHAGATGPVVWEMYMDNFRFWATHEITEGTVSIYRYLSQVFFLRKKHWNKVAAKIVSFIAAPFMCLYVTGWELIPSYSDMRLSRTIKTTMEVLKEGCNVVIFPENSSQGYYDELPSVHPGFCLAGEAALKNGIDVDLVLSYLKAADDRCLIIDSPVKFSKLKECYGTRDAMADFVCSRINELGLMARQDR